MSDRLLDVRLLGELKISWRQGCIRLGPISQVLKKNNILMQSGSKVGLYLA